MYMFPKGTPDPEYPHDANQTGVRGQAEPGAGVAGQAPGDGGSRVRGYSGARPGVSGYGLRPGSALPGSPVCVEPHGAPSGGQ